MSAGRPWRGALQAIAALAVLLALDRGADHLARRWVLADLAASAGAAAELRGAVLQAEIEKQRSLPVILAQDPDLREALAAPSPARLDALNAKLEALARGTRTAVIYALDRDGLALAASNWRTGTSFVGSDYAFRPYFQDALRHGAAEHFALGTVSNRPGLYLARRLDGPEGPVGVIVVKAEFEAVEEAWRRLPGPVLAADPRGIVTVTSVPAWHFLATRPLAGPEREAIRESLQFGTLPLGDLRFAPLAGDATLRRLPPGARPEESPALPVSRPVPGTGWTLTLLTPVRPVLEPARAAARLGALLLGGVALAGVALALRRRGRLRRDLARDSARRQELEEQVSRRTAELRTANDRLRAEAVERQRAEATLHGLRDELAQANRLAILGQITASVAHEINQPLAAIRTFADNARKLLGRGDAATAGRAVETIAGLTERIGTITEGLRGFARKGGRESEPVALRAAIEGALLLVGHRLRQQGIAVEVAVEGEPRLRAERVRLEQVLVNLIQNAIEALQGRADGRIRIGAAAGPEGGATLRVADNGPGLAPAVRRSLFMPFTTTKSAGLGLGLVICRDIVADLGGTLEAPERAEGAEFVMTFGKTL